MVGRSYRRDCTWSCFIHGQTNRYSFFRGGGLGGRPRTPKDSPLWGRPSRARAGKRTSGSGKHTQWVDDRRFEELDSDGDDGHGVGINGSFVSDELQFTGQDLGRPQRAYEYSDSSESSESLEGYDNDKGTGGSMQLALRDKEEMLVQKALERIRRAQELGKKNVKLTQPELDALERKRQKDRNMKEQENRRKSGSKITGDDRRRNNSQASVAVSSRNPIRRKSKGYFSTYDDESSSGSRRATPPSALMPGPGATGFSPLGHYPPNQGRSSPKSSRSPSSQNLTQPSPTLPHSNTQRFPSVPEPSTTPLSRAPVMRRLPDDADWTPRFRSSSSVSGHSHPYDPYQYQVYSPSPQIPPQYVQGRRAVSSPQPDVQYPRLRGDAQPHYSGSSSLRREHSGRASPEDSNSAHGYSSGSDDGRDVQVNMVPYGQNYTPSNRTEYTGRERPRRSGR